jgi:hypothetical protein
MKPVSLFARVFRFFPIPTSPMHPFGLLTEFRHSGIIPGMRIIYSVRWGKTGNPKYVDADHLDEQIAFFLSDGAEPEEIFIAFEVSR